MINETMSFSVYERDTFGSSIKEQLGKAMEHHSHKHNKKQNLFQKKIRKVMAMDMLVAILLIVLYLFLGHLV